MTLLLIIGGLILIGLIIFFSDNKTEPLKVGDEWVVYCGFESIFIKILKIDENKIYYSRTVMEDNTIVTKYNTYYTDETSFLIYLGMIDARKK